MAKQDTTKKPSVNEELWLCNIWNPSIGKHNTLPCGFTFDQAWAIKKVLKELGIKATMSTRPMGEV